MSPSLSTKSWVGPSGKVEEKFIDMPLETLQLNSIVNFDLYLKMGRKYLFYRQNQLPFTEEHKDNLLSNRVKTIYVNFGQRDAYLDYVEQHLTSIIANEKLSMKERAGLVYNSATKLVKDIIENPSSSDVLKRSKNFIENKVNFILKDENSFRSVVRLMSHDYYTYTHSVNVCTFCIAMATHRLGIQDVDILKELGTGAVLHDLGKSRIDKSILTRPRSLTPEEWAIMKQHPQWGLDIVQSHGEISDIIKTVILSHHEKCDGSGYPAGLKDGEIPFYAKVGCLVDVYDALTTKRPYRGKLQPFEALAVMRDEMKNSLDKDLLVELIQLLKG